MSDSPWHTELTSVLWTLQIVVGALIAGCVAFLVIVLVLLGGMPDGDEPLLLTYVAIAFAASALIARMVIPGVIISRGRRKIAQGTWRSSQQSTLPPACSKFLEQAGDAGKLWMLFSTATIVAAAILEGAAFFMLVVVLVEKSPLALIVALMLILGLMLHFPTHPRTVRWIEDQLRLIEQERQLDGRPLPPQNRH